jgi:hypothetical protein
MGGHIYPSFRILVKPALPVMGSFLGLRTRSISPAEVESYR